MAKAAKAKHLQARVHFLEKAAEYMAKQMFISSLSPDDNNTASPAKYSGPHTGTPLVLGSHLRTVAKRSQIRLAQQVKRSMCKTCNTPHVQDETCTTKVLNASKGGIKPWADVKVVTCLNCGVKRRFPIGAKRQQRRGLRSSTVQAATADAGEKAAAPVVNAG